MRLWQQGMIFLARNKSVKNFMQNRTTMDKLSTRFVGGNNASAATEKAKELRHRGCNSSLFYLGEYVEDLAVINQTISELKSVINCLAELNLDVHVSVDPTQIGYQIDAKLCEANALDLATKIKTATNEASKSSRNLLMLDMEDSSVTEATIDIYKKLKSELLPGAITMQAYLHRTENDLKDIIEIGGAVRLVKGAFAERTNIAFTKRKEIDENFIKLADMMLSEKARKTRFYPIFGTHDHLIVDEVVKLANSRGWQKNEYEFEMLYGVRTYYQEKLIQAGEQVRLYLPFGADWWPYAIRRIGESSKNTKFLIKSLFSR